MMPLPIEGDALLLLGLLSGFTAFLTAGLGIGGGVLLLMGLTWFVPIAAVIPLHGVAQIGANAGRTWLQRGQVQRAVLLPFLIGALIGTALGGQVVMTLDEDTLSAVLGLFVLLAVWARWPAAWPSASEAVQRRLFWSGSVGISVLSMGVGATGPLVAALLRRQLASKEALVATFSACMTVQHGLKVLMFAGLGFAFGPWLPVLAVMLATGWVGTWWGNRWLIRRSDGRFQRGMDWLLTALALHLLLQAL